MVASGIVAIAHWADGEDGSGYFPRAGATITVPMSDLKAGAGSLGSLAYRYLLLGADHILFGIDHLLFVLGLLLLLNGFWRLLKTITAFTVAHSVTLACAVLGIFPVPGPPIEVLIALSILMLAREVVMSQRGQMTLVHRKPWIVAFVFGLFHGFGFAGALGTLGLSDSDIPLALLFFNLGVEGGQVIFICTMILVNWVSEKSHPTVWAVSIGVWPMDLAASRAFGFWSGCLRFCGGLEWQQTVAILIGSRDTRRPVISDRFDDSFHKAGTAHHCLPLIAHFHRAYLLPPGLVGPQQAAAD